LPHSDIQLGEDVEEAAIKFLEHIFLQHTAVGRLEGVDHRPCNPSCLGSRYTTRGGFPSRQDETQGSKWYQRSQGMAGCSQAYWLLTVSGRRWHELPTNKKVGSREVGQIEPSMKGYSWPKLLLDDAAAKSSHDDPKFCADRWEGNCGTACRGNS